jgi:hypothetical protein
MRILVLYLLLSYPLSIFGQLACPNNFKMGSSGVSLIKASAEMFMLFDFEDDIISIPLASIGYEHSLGKYWSFSAFAGSGLGQSLYKKIGQLEDTYTLFGIETKYFPKQLFEKWHYGVKITSFVSPKDGIFPLPTLQMGYTQRKQKRWVYDYTIGCLYIPDPDVVILNFGFSVGYIFSDKTDKR